MFNKFILLSCQNTSKFYFAWNEFFSVSNSITLNWSASEWVKMNRWRRRGKWSPVTHSDGSEHEAFSWMWTLLSVNELKFLRAKLTGLVTSTTHTTQFTCVCARVWVCVVCPPAWVCLCECVCVLVTNPCFFALQKPELSSPDVKRKLHYHTVSHWTPPASLSLSSLTHLLYQFNVILLLTEKNSFHAKFKI